MSSTKRKADLPEEALKLTAGFGSCRSAAAAAVAGQNSVNSLSSDDAASKAPGKQYVALEIATTDGPSKELGVIAKAQNPTVAQELLDLRAESVGCSVSMNPRPARARVVVDGGILAGESPAVVSRYGHLHQTAMKLVVSRSAS